jgi:hypothetical protein
VADGVGEDDGDPANACVHSNSNAISAKQRRIGGPLLQRRGVMNHGRLASIL